jgi:hypothetical protein
VILRYSDRLTGGAGMVCELLLAEGMVAFRKPRWR